MDGWSAEEVFAPPNGHGLDEVVFLPGPSSSASTPVDLSTKITRNIELRWPVVSGPSDAVTEASMAAAMALEGGIGIIHRNQSIAAQAAMIRSVKQYETGFILHCQTLKPFNTVGDARKLQEERGCSGIPITDNGKVGGKLLGMVTRRDVDMVDDVKMPLKAVMTKDVLFIREPVAIKQAREVMAKAKVAKLPVVNKDKELVALICRGDLKREHEHPHASRDANRSLLVGAAVSPAEPDAWERVEALIGAGADFLCIDTDEGVFPDTIHFIKRLKDTQEGLDLLAGRVQSWRQAKDLCDAGVDGIRVGGSSSADASALYATAKLAREEPYQIPVLADCEVGDVGRMLKALCLGACTVTLDPLLASLEEAPGEHFYREGVRVKLRPGYATGDHHQMRLGTAGVSVMGGSVASVLPRLLEGVKIGMREVGISSLGNVPGALSSGALRLERQIPREVKEYLPSLARVAVSTLHTRW